MAIRDAGRKLNTFDLSGCVLYTTCYPCPMCPSAIIRANIETVCYGNTKEDAEEIGFRDNMIYRYFRNRAHGTEDKLLQLIPMDREETLQTFQEYMAKDEKTPY
ncbi:MAG: nucleoside deaminase [Erysipelotrichaceae bacterium]|nr:nucleoside deaminase [Erysipelotrichaceae bacterium]